MITYNKLENILENAFNDASADYNNEAFKKILDSTFEELVKKSKKYLVQHFRLKNQVIINIGTIQKDGTYMASEGTIHDNYRRDVFKYEYWSEDDYQNFKQFKEKLIT